MLGGHKTDFKWSTLGPVGSYALRLRTRLALRELAICPVFELHGSQSMPGPITCYDGPLTIRKIPGTEGAAVGPLTFV